MSLFDFLRPFGITNNYTGCSQLIRAIEIVLEKPDGIQAVHKQIYAVIAKEYDLQPRSVESNIRTLSDIGMRKTILPDWYKLQDTHWTIARLLCSS